MDFSGIEVPKRILPLTDAQCRQAKYSADGGNRLRDGGGLYLEVLPSGTKKWRMKYQRPGTKSENLLTFGDYPQITLANARDKRSDAKRLLADDIDPALQREIDRQTIAAAAANTFESLAKDWLAIKRKGWSASHDKRVTAILNNDIFPQIGKRPISDLNGPTVLAILRKIEQRGAHQIAMKALEACGGICRHACAIGASDRDPTAGLREHLSPKPPTQNYPRVTEDELPALLSKIDGYRGAPETRIAIKLLTLTFLRTNEFRWGRWEEIDWNACEWRVPAERMKGTQTQKASGRPHIVPLCSQAIALLNDLQPLTGRYPLLFPGTKDPRNQAISAETMNKALKSLGFEGKQTGHGFRGLASTLLNERSGFSRDAIELQLAHAIGNKVSRAYDHSQRLEERHALMQWWGDFIDQKLGANVYPLRQSA
ncbi:integrase arm-type DNA-binding domain-containing protein [Cupriavidus sp. AcVe19-1a]|nr:integrase arm-type DNA-binding domain-containing protein [Cupriavidus sp. AcVe19-1a]